MMCHLHTLKLFSFLSDTVNQLKQTLANQQGVENYEIIQ